MFLASDSGDLGYLLRDHIWIVVLGVYHVSEGLTLGLIIIVLAPISSISVFIVYFGSSVMIAFVKVKD